MRTNAFVAAAACSLLSMIGMPAAAGQDPAACPTAATQQDSLSDLVHRYCDSQWQSAQLRQSVKAEGYGDFVMRCEARCEPKKKVGAVLPLVGITGVVSAIAAVNDDKGGRDKPASP